ncbi:hypothetical protein [Psychromonas sp. Urea-02u-13]|uniref:hypothetical protein n=1 Tax=Psychromonas sp. Urea-02u-13 TaxID=2058326 RepID=UPI000C3217C5|nr:hypothetical protein [Psychromonas sp. Urea-02u-13]PKG37295.1 hypothetical protein CXF74_19685 [Psychromonas sp. Urea-02u-13]
MNNLAKKVFYKMLRSTFVAYWYFYSLELRYEDKGGHHFVAAFACFFSFFLFIAGLSGLISLFDLIFPNYKWFFLLIFQA